MKNGIVIIAHAPLASALRLSVVHVFAERAEQVVAVDVQPDATVSHSLAQAQQAMAPLGDVPLLLLTDVMGATPCNVARQVLEVGERGEKREACVLAGVNLPMLLRAITYQNEPLAALAACALQGGTQGVLAVANCPALDTVKQSEMESNKS